MSAGLPDSRAPSVAAATGIESSSGEVELEAGAHASAGTQLRAHLHGVGLWTPAYANFEDWVAAGLPERWASTEAQVRPPATLLHPRLRRRTSTLTRASVTALEAATAQAGVSLEGLRFVLVSSFGEIETTVALLEQLGDPGGPISPTKFHNSVHNTATGYLSIASGNQREATALAAGPHSLEIGLLEVLAGFVSEGEAASDAVLLFAEESLPAPFARSDADPTFAAAFLLSPRRRASTPGGLGIELRLSEGETPAAPTALAPGVGGVGLPSMIPSLLELLRTVASAGTDVGSSELTTGRTLALAGGHDPGVASAWTLSLHSQDP